MIEVANTKTTKAAQVRAYVAKNPNAKPQEIADAVGTGLQYVYTVMWNVKRKAKLKRAAVKKAMATQKQVLKGAIEHWKNISVTSSNTPMQIEMFDNTPDPVDHPAHYKVGGIETIDFIEAKKLNYNIGNVVKYLTRADHKGNKLEDLRKAQWYLTREISSLK
jgi:hypothetical protein